MLDVKVDKRDMLVDVKEINVEDKYIFGFPEYFLTQSDEYLNGMKGLPKQGGIYFVYEIEGTDEIEIDSLSDEDIVYIGATNSLFRRTKEHFTAYGVGNPYIYENLTKDDTEYIYVISTIYEEDKERRDYIEKHFIRELQPRYNKEYTEKFNGTIGKKWIPKRVLTPKYIEAMGILKKNSYTETERKTGISRSTLQRIKKQYIEETGDVF